MIKMFRPLRADEIDVRVARVTANNVALLLYKDARCDMNILDETVGAMNWQRSHLNGNANCIVSIYDTDKGQWVSKEDTGTESNTEKEKGQASDSFKRACFNWGIGRELYTAPKIEVWVKNEAVKITGNKCYDTFSVSKIKTENGIIQSLEIINENLNKVAFRFGTKSKTTKETPKPQEVPPPPATIEPPAQTAKPQKTVYRCEVCGAEITDYIFEGKVLKTVNEILGHSINTYSKKMCFKCLKKQINADKAGAVNGN